MANLPLRSRRARRLVVLSLISGLALAAAGPAQAGKPTPEIVDSTRHEGKFVALTFDDGPDPRNTPRLLRVLRKHHITAVFCLWGDHVREHPEIVRRIARAGHVLCNHTMHHDDMGTWPADRIRADLQQTNAVIRQAVPGARIPYFRAPYGSWGQTPAVAAQLGMQPLGWRLAVADWSRREPTSWSAGWRRASPLARWSSCTTGAATAARPSRPSTGSSRGCGLRAGASTCPPAAATPMTAKSTASTID
jgi:peptidoglycan/xylan/chitin deacetylase (PgdA/CDA1 family)